MTNRRRFFISSLVVLVFAASCTGYKTAREAELAERNEDWDEAVVKYLEVVAENPSNIRYRAALVRAKIRASQEHFERGKTFHEAGVLQQALVEYQQAVQLDPTNQYAQVELSKIREELAAADADRESILNLDQLKERSQKTRPQPPMLNPRSGEPISVDFPEEISVFDIYRALGTAFGINILFDSALKDEKMTLQLTDVTAEKALEHLMRAAKHFYKVLDEQTIIVAADSPQNRRLYEDHIIQTFFLSNADVKETMTMLRSLVGAKNIAANDQLNAIVLRDTVDKVKVAERIIEANDKARGEVVVDVELLQINSNKMRQLGVSLSEYQITQTLDLGGEDVPLRLSDIEFLNQSNWILTIPSFIYDFVKQSSDAELLAKPQLRISDGETANLTIGDRVPIPVTSFNTAQTVGSNVVPITSFQYTDVGIQIDIEPRIHHNQEVTLTVGIEVSNLAGFVSGSAGEQQPIIGSRTFESTIRLKDGETNFLAGLIREDETRALTGIPGVSDIPILGRLFSRNDTDSQRTDVVITMTPHIVRTADITEKDLTPIWVGTEANITFRGGSTRIESDAEGPFEDDDEDDSERIREMLQRRIQNLPRGLRESFENQTEESGEEEQGTPGIDLLDPGRPLDIFGTEEDDDGGDGPNLSVLETSSAVRFASPGDETGDLDPAEAPIRLALSPGGLIVRPGEVFEIAVRVEADSEVSHLPINLAFNSEVLEVDSVTPGDFFGGGSEAAILSDHSTPGSVVLGASRLGEIDGVKGSGVLARIRFKAIAEGLSEIGFAKGKALDRRLAPVGPVSTRPAYVQSGGDVERPERPKKERPENRET